MNFQSSFDYFLKIIIVGDSSVGKTNFIFRFIDGTFNKIYQPTIGIDYKSIIKVLPKSKQKVKIQFWDTAGQERYKSLNKIYFQRVQGIILMYDITNKESFDNLDSWTRLIFENISSIPIVLIGNKLDLEEEERIIRTEDGKSFADDNGFLFFETSALNGKNVDNAIYSLCERIISSLERTSSFNVNTSIPFNDILEEKTIKEKKEKKPCC